MSSGTCCGCFSYRQGAVVAIGVGFVVGISIVGLFTFLAFDSLSITQALIREKLLGNSSMAIFIFNAIIPMVSVGVLSNSAFTSGGGTKVIALLIFIVGVLWFVFGSMLARRLNNGYTMFLPSGQAFKQYAKNPQNKLMLGAAVGSALVLDKAWAGFAMSNLPFPLNYFYWLGMRPVVPFLVFGLVPALVTWSSLGVIVSLASVMDAGGDGTEYVEAKRIHWFYSLSPPDRERVREGSDLEEEDSSVESGHEERGGIGKRVSRSAT